MGLSRRHHCSIAGAAADVPVLVRSRASPCHKQIPARPNRDIASCGVEVLTLGGDGLTNSRVGGLRPRAILSGTLIVGDEFRRMGVARALLWEAEHVARVWGMGELLLMVHTQNVAALGLYKKLGYVAMPRTREHGKQVCLRKRLFAPTRHTLGALLPKPPLVVARA